MTPNADELDITAQAFMDDELLPAERLEFLERMQQDAALRRRFCECLYQKELVRHAYAALPHPRSRLRREMAGQRLRRAALVAVFAGLVSAAVGQYVHAGQAGARSAPRATEPASRAVISGSPVPRGHQIADPRGSEKSGDPC